MTNIYYVYYSYEEWGRGYIGKRKCPTDKTPETDKYFGSYKDKTFKPTKKIILEVYKTNEEALQAEIDLHNFYRVDVNPHFANKAKQTSKSFTTCGLKPWNKGLKGKKVLKGWSKGLKLPPLSDSHKRKISDALKNREVSESCRNKIRDKLKNKPKSEKHKQALRDSKPKPKFNWINKNTQEIILNMSVIDLISKYPEDLKVKSCLYIWLLKGRNPNIRDGICMTISSLV